MEDDEIPGGIEPEESPPFDIHEAIARAVRESEEGEPAEDDESSEGGPEDEIPGELPQEDDDDSEDLEDPSDADVEEEGEEEEPEAEEPEAVPEPAPEPDSRDLEIDRLKRLVEDSQTAQQKILDLLASRQLAPQAPVAKDLGLPIEVAKMAVFGGKDEDWKLIPPDVRDKATKFAASYAETQTRYALDPEAQYQEVFSQRVLASVYDYFQPLIKDYHDRQASQVFQPVVQEFTDPAEKQRLYEIYQTIPGASSDNLGDQQKALHIAVKLAKAEKAERGIGERDRAIAAKERQIKATKKASRKSSGKRAGAPEPAKKAPRLEPGEDLGRFAERLRASGF